ncbi:MAG: hypothetical protein NUV63_08195 [Gallionella sp.]|nr:hypothetical protein [Gallionella sp.]
MMLEIIFPFMRQSWYSLKELADFEDALLVARRQDKQLDDELRLARQPWMKLRNDELYPLRYFAEQTHLAEDAQFKICDEGADADFELKVVGEATRRLQVTRAGPIWTPDNPNWGFDHKLHMAKLNREGQSSGWGPYRKNSDGLISNWEEIISTEERDRPYLEGLINALKGKQDHRIPDCDLIVHAVTYHEAINPQTFACIANAALSNVSLNNFRNVYILDYGEGYFVERSP